MLEICEFDLPIIQHLLSYALIDRFPDKILCVEPKQEAFVKILETSELDFSRYGDTLFEVFFTGSASGSSGQEVGELKLEHNVRTAS